jgi:D-alanine-D-alanine ligase
MSGSATRLLVVTGDHSLPDATKSGARYGEEDLKVHRAMEEAFASLDGYEVTVCCEHASLLDRLRSEPPDLVVNFCDTGFRNEATQELVLPSYLEMLGIPYTGASPAAMVLAYDKQIVRLVAQNLGVAVPDEVFLPGGDDTHLSVRYPALIKPNRADGSVGITKDAVVENDDEARAYLAWLRKTLPGCDALLQEYLPGAEYGIGLIGNPGGGLRALPALEVDFSALPAGLSPILSFESKAVPDSPYWTDITFGPAALDDAVEAGMVRDCERLFQRFGLRDYGRFDFRCDGAGNPKLMEVNPNPAWGNDGKLAFMAGFAGIAYPQMLGMIVEAALVRLGRRSSDPSARC